MEKKWLVNFTGIGGGGIGGGGIGGGGIGGGGIGGGGIGAHGLRVTQSAQFCFLAVVYAAESISAATPKQLEQGILHALAAEPLASACLGMDPPEILKAARRARPPSDDYHSLNPLLQGVLPFKERSGMSNPDFDVPKGAIRRISEAGRLGLSKVRGEGGAQGGEDRSKRGGSGCGGSGRLGGAGKQQAGWAWRSERDDIARLRQKRRPPTPPPPSLRSVAAPPPLPTL